MPTDGEREETVLGMPLAPGELHDLAQPLEAVVVIKGLSETGETSYWSTSTPDLNTVECLGMIGYADVVLRAGLARDDDE